MAAEGRRSRLRADTVGTAECCGAIEGFLKAEKTHDLAGVLQRFDKERWHHAATPEALSAFAPLAERIFRAAPTGVLGHAALRQALLASHKAKPMLHSPRGPDLEADRLSGVIRMMLAKVRDLALDGSRARAVRKAATPEQLRRIVAAVSALRVPVGRADQRALLQLPEEREDGTPPGEAAAAAAAEQSQCSWPPSKQGASEAKQEAAVAEGARQGQGEAVTCTALVPFQEVTGTLVAFGLVTSKLTRNVDRSEPEGPEWSPFVWPDAAPGASKSSPAPAGSGRPPAAAAGHLSLAAGMLGAGAAEVLAALASQPPLPAAIRGQSKRVAHATAAEGGEAVAAGKPAARQRQAKAKAARRQGHGKAKAKAKAARQGPGKATAKAEAGADEQATVKTKRAPRAVESTAGDDVGPVAAAGGRRPLSQTPHCVFSRAYHKARRLAVQAGRSDEEARAEAACAGRAAVAALQA
jgi:hypothetical protein